MDTKYSLETAGSMASQDKAYKKIEWMIFITLLAAGVAALNQNGEKGGHLHQKKVTIGWTPCIS